MSPKSTWIIDDDPGIRYVLEEYLKSQEMKVRVFSDGHSLLKAFEGNEVEAPDLVIADIRLEGESGLDLMQTLRKTEPDLPVIIMTAYSDLETAVGAFQGGAFEFLSKPFDLQEVARLIQKATTRSKAISTEEPSIGLIGQSSAFQELIRMLGRLSHTDIPVLITGETGVGKELVARALHQHSPRAQGPFVAINMAAIPDDLLESELFGHERGSFTGANERRIGRFEQAGRGTLFLDEIGDMPLRLQTRLLRVLAEGEYYRLGGRDLIKAQARIITATNQNLDLLVEQGRFRADLYHRLKVISLMVPPLRERREDIPQLIEHFLDLASEEFNIPRKSADTGVIEHLCQLAWPGNVRELKNVCQSMSVLSPARIIQMDDLPIDYQTERAQSNASKSHHEDWADHLSRTIELSEASEELFEQYKQRFEVAIARAALAQCRGNQSKAAKKLGISRNTLARFLSQTGP
jgi:two-component system nitrogen regulation response regulator GlnG